MSEPRTARTRLRFVFGMPTRKTDFHTCELTMPSLSAVRLAIPLLKGLLGCEVAERNRPSPCNPVTQATWHFAT